MAVAKAKPLLIKEAQSACTAALFAAVLTVSASAAGTGRTRAGRGNNGSRTLDGQWGLPDQLLALVLWQLPWLANCQVDAAHAGKR